MATRRTFMVVAALMATAVTMISMPSPAGAEEDTMPKSGGTTALFIDWIGVSGGVGRGFHGVGGEGRGVGIR